MAPGSGGEGRLLPPGVGPQAPVGPFASLGGGKGEVRVSTDAGRVGTNQLRLPGLQGGPEAGGQVEEMRLGGETTHPGEAGGSCPRRPSGTSQALCTRRLCQRTAAPCSPKIDARAAPPPQRWPRAGTGRHERSSGCSPAGGSFLTDPPTPPPALPSSSRPR